MKSQAIVILVLLGHSMGCSLFLELEPIGRGDCGENEYVLTEATDTTDLLCAPHRQAGSACTADAQCEFDECQRGYCKLPGFAVISSGTFTQGSPTNETNRDSDEAQREVTLTRAFFLQEKEVTQAQWLALMGNNPSNFRSDSSENRPVETVSWWDGIAFTNALSAAEGLEQCYVASGCTGTFGADYSCTEITFEGLDCEGYRLPTEAEWEYAARAGTSTMTYAGDHHAEMRCQDSPVLSSIGWWCQNSDSTTNDVGQKSPNDWGLYDMIGNVWEWNWDWYGAYEPGPVTDPIGPATGALRINRGCSWSSFRASNCRGGAAALHRTRPQKRQQHWAASGENDPMRRISTPLQFTLNLLRTAASMPA